MIIVRTILDRSTWLIGSRVAPNTVQPPSPTVTDTGSAPSFTWDGPRAVSMAIAADSEVRAVRFSIGGGRRTGQVDLGMAHLVEGAPVKIVLRPRETIEFDRLDGTDGLLRVAFGTEDADFDDLPRLIAGRTTVVLGRDGNGVTSYVGEGAVSPLVHHVDLAGPRGQTGLVNRQIIGRVLASVAAAGNITAHGLIRSPRDGRVLYESVALVTVASGAVDALVAIAPTSLAGFNDCRVRFPAHATCVFRGTVTLL